MAYLLIIREPRGQRAERGQPLAVPEQIVHAVGVLREQLARAGVQEAPAVGIDVEQDVVDRVHPEVVRLDAFVFADAGGAVDPDDVRAAVKPDDPHFARTRLLCLENTVSGMVIDLDHMTAVARAAHDAGLRVHLDGARILNAAIALGITPARATAFADTVSVCLSKGLGAPVGSVLVGSTDAMAEARVWRKRYGAGMRQAMPRAIAT